MISAQFVSAYLPGVFFFEVSIQLIIEFNMSKETR